MAGAVQRRRCTIAELEAELSAGPVRNSAGLRAVLAEVADGIRSAAEGDFLGLIKNSGLPMPLLNRRLYVDGKFLANPDAWWPEAGVIVEVDSREWHALPEDWERTMARHAELGAAGLVALHFSPHQLRTEPDQVLRKIAGALAAGRPVPGIVTRPAAA